MSGERPEFFGDKTADGHPIPPIPEELELPPGWDPTALPLIEVQIWLLDLPLHERAERITRQRISSKN